MITAYIIIDAKGFRRIGGCVSASDLQSIVDGYSEPPRSVVKEQIPKEHFDDWRNRQNLQTYERTT